MGAREDFEQAVRRGDFVSAAAVWTKENLEASPSLDAFQTKLRASLEDREVTIGRTLVATDGEYEYLGDAGQNGARLAFVPNAGSLDQIEFIADMDALQAHFGQSNTSPTDKEAVAAFFAMSERAVARGRQVVSSQDLSGTEALPVPAVADAPAMAPADALRHLLAGHGDSPEMIGATVSHASKNFVNDRVYVGILRDFGPAPYLHDKDNTQSYFVTFQDPNGKEETVWGKDLASAVQDEDLQPGAEFILAFQGSKPVTVKVKVRDAEGKLTGEVTEAPAVRNGWLAISVARLRAEAAELGPAELAQSTSVGTIERAESLSIDATGQPLTPEVPAPDVEQIDAIEGVAKSAPVVDAEQQNEDAIQGVPRAKAALASDRHATEDAIVGVPKDGEKGKDAENAAAGKKPLTTLLNGRFILRENGEYFRIDEGGESKRVALVDEETKIRFVDKQMDTFQAAIELAKHKDWEAILVTGSEKFRAEAWHHARMAGLEVIGYEPTDKDLASLKAAQENGVKPKAGQQLGSPLATSNADVANVKSLAEINKLVLDAGYGARPAALDNSKNDGRIMFESDKHFAQDTGRKVATIHDKANFDRSALRAAIEVGGSMKVQYENGRATIESKKDRSQARGR